ncbi:MAG: EF-P beta-lysylation protein EpmB [Sedimenticolaceae bacterium]|nr:EF-P beta-lysylation protein EpmB [Sedimenticolaceae bacterium]
MITRTLEMPKIPDWQGQMATGFTRVADLLAWLEIEPASLEKPVDSESDFPMKVPRAYAARMRKGDPEDPLLRQVLPLHAENEAVPGFISDPVGDLAACRGQGVIRKYHGRALLMTTGACAIHCRYCFRRHFPYQSHHIERILSRESIETLNDAGIEEIILSGGDPLALGDDRLQLLLDSLGKLENLRRLRIHTRLPIVIPDRVTQRLVDMLAGFPVPVTVVLHINHPNEIDPQTQEVCRRLFSSGIHLLNQAVLLKGVNDATGILEELCIKGFEAGILPYYVHQLDKVSGSAHFLVSSIDALRIQEELRNTLPGYLLPRFVAEMPGKESKIPLGQEIY